MTDRRAITLRETLVGLVVVGVVVVLIIVGMSRSRRKGREALCSSNLRQMAIMYQNYGIDYKDRLFGFSWRVGNENPYQWPEMPTATTDLEAVSNEFVAMLRFRMEMKDLEPIRGWLPNAKYTHNVLNEYMATRMPINIAVCPDDDSRRWAIPRKVKGETRSGKDARYEPMEWPPVPSANADRRWAFSASYEFVPASYSPDQGAPGAPTIMQGETDGEYVVPRVNPFGAEARKLTEIAFPKDKVGIFDSHDRHYSKKPRFYADPAARQPLMFYDASVRVYRTRETDAGFRPNEPWSAEATVFDYKPEGEAARWYPAAVNADGVKEFKGYYRWTRGGLKGRDVGGAVGLVGGAVWAVDEAAVERVER
jgi:hypothetical protein